MQEAPYQRRPPQPTFPPAARPDGLARAVQDQHDRPHVPGQAAAARRCLEKVGVASRHVDHGHDRDRVARRHASFTNGRGGEGLLVRCLLLVEGRVEFGASRPEKMTFCKAALPRRAACTAVLPCAGSCARSAPRWRKGRAGRSFKLLAAKVGVRLRARPLPQSARRTERFFSAPRGPSAPRCCCSLTPPPAAQRPSLGTARHAGCAACPRIGGTRRAGPRLRAQKEGRAFVDALRVVAHGEMQGHHARGLARHHHLAEMAALEGRAGHCPLKQHLSRKLLSPQKQVDLQVVLGRLRRSSRASWCVAGTRAP
jgi:hypothetical protein